MLFIPKKSKFVKQQKGKAFNRINKLTSSNQLQKGCIGLISMDSGRLSSKQLISLRQTLNKYVKKKGRIFINIFPQIPITNKPTKVRMGKGKGNVDH
jgi:large subunit ribosomal protein L16